MFWAFLDVLNEWLDHSWDGALISLLIKTCKSSGVQLISCVLEYGWGCFAYILWYSQPTGACNQDVCVSTLILLIGGLVSVPFSPGFLPLCIWSLILANANFLLYFFVLRVRVKMSSTWRSNYCNPLNKPRHSAAKKCLRPVTKKMREQFG